MKSLWMAMILGIAGLAASAQAADSPKSNFFEVKGVKIHYLTKGEGEPVVLIHALHSSAEINWVLPGIFAELAKDHQVIALDLPGHGRSDKPEGDEAYGAQLVEDVVLLMDRLKIKKAHVVGYSMGGIIAGNFIAKHPDRVLSGTLGGMGWLKAGGFGETAFGRIGKNDPNAKPMSICGRSLAKLSLTEDEIKSIRVPVAIVIGEKDNMIKKLYLDPLVKVRNDWPVIDIKDANHITCILKPSFREEIAAWLKKNAK